MENILYMFWFLTAIVNYFKPVISQPWLSTHNITFDHNNYLIDTPGCRIPDFYMPFINITSDARYVCGERKVFIRKLRNNRIILRFRERFTACRYRFIYRFPAIIIDEFFINYSKWVKFKDGTIANLKSDFIQVKCNRPNYEDLYINVNKRKINKKSNGLWNVLIVGMDTVSRARAIHDLPLMYNQVLEGNWLDFKGYNKIAYDTVPNLMSVLTRQKYSKSMEEITNTSVKNDLFIWKQFQDAGYVTAFGEDELFLMNSPSSKMMHFADAPTMHYLRTLYVAGEEHINTIVCPKKLISGEYLLRFASDFAKTYLKSNRFFGFFWISSLSTATSYGLSQIDITMETFLKTLNSSGVLKNTFVILLGNHGTLFGPDMIPVESYYESRLPMLFMSVPQSFKEDIYGQYATLASNQHRLVTPFDLHLTLWDILTNIENSVDIPKLPFCPKCRSLFSKISQSRSCEDAGVPDKWCTCHDMYAVKDPNDYGAFYSIVQTLFSIHNMTQAVVTQTCTRCADLSLKKLLRIHMYEGILGLQSVQYYEMVVILVPEDVGFVASVRRFANNTFEVVQPIYVIGSSYTNKSYCVENPVHKVYCVCTKSKCRQPSNFLNPNSQPSLRKINDNSEANPEVANNDMDQPHDTIWSAIRSWIWPSQHRKRSRQETEPIPESTWERLARIWPKLEKKWETNNMTQKFEHTH